MITTNFHLSGNLIPCFRCGKQEFKGHSVYWCPSSGCSPICESCWGESTINERVAYFAMLYGYWLGQSVFNRHLPKPESFHVIEEAVRVASAMPLVKKPLDNPPAM